MTVKRKLRKWCRSVATNLFVVRGERDAHEKGMLRCPILPKEKLAFVAIPKNAGTSIRVAFGIAQGFVRQGEIVKKVSSKPWPGVGSKAEIEALRNSGFLRFCVSRNPWERLVSCWQQKIMNRSSSSFTWKTKNHGLFHAHMDFPSFVEAALSVPEEKANRHYRSQVGFIMHKDTVLVDRILRFENLEEDWECLRKEYDLPALPHYKQTSSAESYQRIYSEYPEIKEQVASRYARDIEFFGYDF